MAEQQREAGEGRESSGVGLRDEDSIDAHLTQHKESLAVIVGGRVMHGGADDDGRPFTEHFGGEEARQGEKRTALVAH